MEAPTTFEKETEPQTLKILCTLTFIFSGIMFLLFLTMIILIKPALKYASENNEVVTAHMSDLQIEQLQTLVSVGPGKIIISCGVILLLIGLSFFGAMQMWHHKYKGFIMYLIANICFLISNATAGTSLNFFMAIMDALFIFLYFRQSKSLEK